jgi:mRNA interferase MazF
MGKFIVGDVIVIPFPFSNLKSQKLRPALIVAHAEFNNLILCQITSRPYSSKHAIKLQKSDFQNGSLPIISFARPDKLFTAEPSTIKSKAGVLYPTKTNQILSCIRTLFTSLT